MHLAICDAKGKDGPHDPKAKVLSRLVSVAVDFAKHGECVTEEDYKDISVSKWPDFMEKDKDKFTVYESQSILGKLYRHVNCELYY